MLINIDEYEFEIDVIDYYAGCAGKYSGPWEDCYPGEPAEVTFNVLGITDGDGVSLEGAHKDNVEAEYCERLENKVLMAMMEDYDDEPYD